MLKYLIWSQELMKRDLSNDMKHINVSVNLETIFLIINNVGMKINVDANVKN